jgi:hypothetical protein
MTTVRTTHLWPELPLAEWKDTYDTLHRWTQIIGKIRLVSGLMLVGIPSPPPLLLLTTRVTLQVRACLKLLPRRD